MAGIRKLRKMQIGLEAIKGTAVAATKVWRGVGVLEDQQEMVFPEEDIGLLSGADRSYVPKLAGGITIEDTELTFQQLPLLLAIGIDDVISGAADGTGTDFIHTFVFPTTADPGFKTYTIEGGDNEAVEEMEYSFASEIILKGTVGEAWMMGATVQGRQVVPSSFTGALAVEAVEEALFSKTKLYIDASAGTIGTTQISNELIDAEITITTGLIPVFTGDGELYFSFAKRQAPEVLMTITFEHDTTSIAEKVAWRAQAVRLIRLECEGSAFASAGTTYTNHTLLIDLAGKWESFEALDEIDGNDVVRGVFRARYSSTDSLFGEIVVANEVEETIAE